MLFRQVHILVQASKSICFSTNTFPRSSLVAIDRPLVNFTMLLYIFLLFTTLLQSVACSSVCGTTPGLCSSNGCAGINVPGGIGHCTNGTYSGCSCTNVCGTSNGACNLGSCSGMNNPGGVGYVEIIFSLVSWHRLRMKRMFCLKKEAKQVHLQTHYETYANS